LPDLREALSDRTLSGSVSYHTAALLGRIIDKPRNLGKSVILE
jgi:hypothetical protein